MYITHQQAYDNGSVWDYFLKCFLFGNVLK
jgi:hypothetical protein